MEIKDAANIGLTLNEVKHKMKTVGYVTCPRCAGAGGNPECDFITGQLLNKVCIMCNSTGIITWLDIATGNVRYAE